MKTIFSFFLILLFSTSLQAQFRNEKEKSSIKRKKLHTIFQSDTIDIHVHEMGCFRFFNTDTDIQIVRTKNGIQLIYKSYEADTIRMLTKAELKKTKKILEKGIRPRKYHCMSHALFSVYNTDYNLSFRDKCYDSSSDPLARLRKLLVGLNF